MVECLNCDAFFHEDDADVETEDQTATVPYGDTFEDTGGFDIKFYCPECGEEVEIDETN